MVISRGSPTIVPGLQCLPRAAGEWDILEGVSPSVWHSIHWKRGGPAGKSQKRRYVLAELGTACEDYASALGSVKLNFGALFDFI